MGVNNSAPTLSIWKKWVYGRIWIIRLWQRTKTLSVLGTGNTLSCSTVRGSAGAQGLLSSFSQSSASQSWELFGQFSMSLKSRICYLLITALAVDRIYVHFGGFPCSWSLEARSGQLFLIIPISVMHRYIISNTYFSSLIPFVGFESNPSDPARKTLSILFCNY